MKKHGERAHSKFSASGAERWFNCPGSVELSEGAKDKDSVWAKEGTQAHEVLEQIMVGAVSAGAHSIGHARFAPSVPRAMVNYGLAAANFILSLHAKMPGSEVLVESKVYLDFIHPEMFGTFDGAVVDHFGTLHVFDYKYGAGHAVSPKENLQMIFYGIGLAYKFNWNFKRVRLWIVQPRIKGYDGPMFWDIPMKQLKEERVPLFEQAVNRVLRNPKEYAEGNWCHWCKAKSLCPLKQEARAEKAVSIFMSNPVNQATTLKGQTNYGKEESKEKSRLKEKGRKAQGKTESGNGSDFY